MTWSELGEFIELMAPAQRTGPVKFIEPYDKERAGHYVAASFALEDVGVAGDNEQEELFVRRGEPLLA